MSDLSILVKPRIELPSNVNPLANASSVNSSAGMLN